MRFVKKKRAAQPSRPGLIKGLITTHIDGSDVKAVVVVKSD